MAKYTVKLKTAPKGHVVPPLLAEVGAWIAKQEHGSLGWFDAMITEAIPKEWDEERAEHLRNNAFSFLRLPDGSMLALVNTGAKTPAAVALLDSEGDSRTIADSLEEFLLLWSKADTSVDDLDEGDEDHDARGALAKWLKDKKLKAPKAPAFDFTSWLAGPSAAKSKTAKASPPASKPEKSTAAPKRAPTAVTKRLGPKLSKLARVMGMRADAAELNAYVTSDLGKKVPISTSATGQGANVTAPTKGVELAFSHDILNDAYPPIPKTAKSFIPYLSFAWVSEKIGEPVLGVPWDSTLEGVTAVLGEPTTYRRQFTTDKKPTLPTWTFALDVAAAIELEITFRKSLRVTLGVKSSLGCEAFPTPSTGLFVAWAATRGLLDEARFGPHADLLKAVKKRKAKGSDLINAALPRGLWTDHLKQDEDLRLAVYQWFHNFGSWITDDLKKLFGKRPGAHGHDAPILDDDTWDAVDKAAPIFEKRFGVFLKR